MFHYSAQGPWGSLRTPWLVWLRADYQKWTFETCQQFQRCTQWHFNLKNYKQQPSSHWPRHLPRNAQWDGCEGVIDKDGSLQGPNQARVWQLRLFWTLSKTHTLHRHIETQTTGLLCLMSVQHTHLVPPSSKCGKDKDFKKPNPPSWSRYLVQAQVLGGCLVFIFLQIRKLGFWERGGDFFSVIRHLGSEFLILTRVDDVAVESKYPY